jgi:hypothetical protein
LRKAWYFFNISYLSFQSSLVKLFSLTLPRFCPWLGYNSGWRILFTKKKDGNLHFVCFAKHDNYEDRLAKLK